MNWRRGGPYHIETTDGRYTVCKVNVFGTFSYGAWRDQGKQAAHLGEFPSAAEAKDCCEQDALVSQVVPV